MATLDTSITPEAQIVKAHLSGNAFIYSSTTLVTATNANLLVCGISVFNPAASGKNILIYSIQPICTGASVQNQWWATTVDPKNGTGYTGTVTPVNLKAGGAVTVASCCSSQTGITVAPAVSGTQLGTYGLPGATFTELLTNGACYLLPQGSANGLTVLVFVPVAAQNFGCLVKGLEF